jgi:tetratricopeptide (TPR) repeat protein
MRRFGEDHPLVARDQAILLQRLGQASQSVGRLAEAMQQYDEALSILTQLAEGHAEDPINQSNLAAIQHSRAEAHERMGKTLQARDDYEQSLQYRLRWANLTENVAGHYGAERSVANAYYALGKIALKLGDPEAALGNYNKQLEWFQKIPPDLRKEPELGRELGQFLQRLGEAYYHSGDAKQSEKMLGESFKKRLGLAEAQQIPPRDVRVARMAFGDQ